MVASYTVVAVYHLGMPLLGSGLGVTPHHAGVLPRDEVLGDSLLKNG